MSVRNYNAWIKAARKASKKTGGLSLPAARKAYRITKERLGRQPKGVDVKRHPRITRQSIVLATAKRRATPVRKGVSVKRTAPQRATKPVKQLAPKVRRIRSFADFAAALDLFDTGEIEYVSTAEYRKK